MKENFAHFENLVLQHLTRHRTLPWELHPCTQWSKNTELVQNICRLKTKFANEKKNALKKLGNKIEKKNHNQM